MKSMKTCIEKAGTLWNIFCQGCGFLLNISSLFLAAATFFTRTCGAATVVYDTAPYWPPVSAILAGMGPAGVSTFAETFVAPAEPNVTLNDFSFYARSYPGGGEVNFHLRAFVYSWSGNLTGPGGRAVGTALYLSPSFLFSPPPHGAAWVPLTGQIGAGGLTLLPGQHYVFGFTLSDPADYAASQGYVEFQTVPVRNPSYPPLIPPGVDFGAGGVVWLNNSNNFAALNTTSWSTSQDFGVMAFTAHFTVVPEPAGAMLMSAGIALWVGWRRSLRLFSSCKVFPQLTSGRHQQTAAKPSSQDHRPFRGCH